MRIIHNKNPPSATTSTTAENSYAKKNTHTPVLGTAYILPYLADQRNEQLRNLECVQTPCRVAHTAIRK
jgi:hypothetical protein